MNRLSRTRNQEHARSPRKTQKRVKPSLKRRRTGLAVSRTLHSDDSSSDDEPGSSIGVGDVFDESPRKRKRHRSSSGESGSWVEMDEDEEEPEFIAESDQHLLQEAPAYALHRLRKAELVRLWKVAGMWVGDDTEVVSEDESGDLGKRQLVEGIVNSRSRLISPVPRDSPRRKAALEAAFEIKRLRGPSPSSSSEPAIDDTPRAPGRLKPRKTPGRSARRLLTRRKKNIKRASSPEGSISSYTTEQSSSAKTPQRRRSTLGSEGSEDQEPTPLVARLRPRRNLSLGGSSQHAVETGDEAEDEGSPAEDSGDEEEAPGSPESEISRTTRSGKMFGTMELRKSQLRQEALDDPDMDVDDTEDEDPVTDLDLNQATITSLTRLLRAELVDMCESRGIPTGGTKPQLAKALIDWRNENKSVSSHATARTRSATIIHAVASHTHVSGKTTPVLMRDHIHVDDPATPQPSSDSKTNGDELNFDLAELGLEDAVIKPSQLQKLERIGSGGFKDVYIGKFRGRKVAISEFREHLSEMDIRELKLLAEFSHPNIVRFRGICIPEDNAQIPCMLVSELCENGDLFDYIRNVPCPPFWRVFRLMLDIARGLEYLHTRQPAIIHRDCKSSNILINSKGQAKVGDFGLARVKHSTRSMIRSLVGTVNWQAPELWHPTPRYDYKVDVFSAAMVYWEMLSGWTAEKAKYPWEGHNEHYIYEQVGRQHRRPSVSGLRKLWGAEPVNLMERMWHQDAAERPTMTDVVTDLEAILDVTPHVDSHRITLP